MNTLYKDTRDEEFMQTKPHITICALYHHILKILQAHDITRCFTYR